MIDKDAFLLRLPIALKEQLRTLATENRRSMNQEIRVAIERSVKCAPQGDNA
jgi:hypothetical protein